MNPILLPILELGVFGLVVAAVLLLARRVESGLNLGRRLNAAQTTGAPTTATPVVRRQGAGNPMLTWVQTQLLSNSADRQKLTRDLIDAGYPSPAAPAIYVMIRFGSAIGLPVLFIVGQSLLSHPLTGLKLILIAVVLSAAGMLLPRVFINSRAGARREQLEAEFPDALDLMIVCVEAGLALEAAFIKVGEETKLSHPRISHEFQLVSQELRAGRTRAEALRSMGERTQVDVVKSFVALLIQTDTLGVSIAQSLRVYSAEMREHRMLRAEEKAMRIPVLLTIPLVICILPVIVMSVMLPVMIDLVRTLIPLLNHVGH